MTFSLSATDVLSSVQLFYSPQPRTTLELKQYYIVSIRVRSTYIACDGIVKKSFNIAQSYKLLVVGLINFDC